MEEEEEEERERVVPRESEVQFFSADINANEFKEPERDQMTLNEEMCVS